MIATSVGEINVWGDVFATAIFLSLIIVGRNMRGATGGLLVFAGLGAFVASGIDSAIKLFGDEWSFAERLYHFAWVWAGIGAFVILRQACRYARALLRAREADRDG